MMETIRRIAVIALILIVGIVPSLVAQSERGSVTGHVTDSSGSVLQGAEVEFQPTGTTVISNQNGAYFINNLTPAPTQSRFRMLDFPCLPRL